MIAASTLNRTVDHPHRDVFLDAYLEPFRPFLSDPAVSEILVNRPGEVWTELAGYPAMQRHSVPAVDDRLMQRLAAQIARVTHQGISREQPLLSATLADGARVQIVGPPATRSGWALSIRRHRTEDMPLDAWLVPGAEAAAVAMPSSPAAPDRTRDPLGWITHAVQARRTILIAGGTSSGKTSFLNTLLRLVPDHERIVVVEDTPEIRLSHANALGLVAVRGELGEAQVNADSLLQATLRLRPDRIVLGELRGNEAATFLRAINTGHPGSFSTIHANSCAGALDQLTFLAMQSSLALSRADALRYAATVIDVVVHLGRVSGRHAITEVRTTAELLPEGPAGRGPRPMDIDCLDRGKQGIDRP